MRRNVMGWMVLSAALLWTAPVLAQDGAPKAQPEPSTSAPAASADKPADAAPSSAASANSASGVQLGPGDRPLRRDYPGTEEAMRARWDGGMATLQEDASDQSYGLRIRELETKIDDLKEKVFRSKSRVVLLEETLLGANATGSKAIIVYKSELGRVFKLRRVLVAMDGNRIYNAQDKEGSLADKETIELYNDNISPGTHRLTMEMQYQGSGYNVFHYMEGYDFRLPETCIFAVEVGKVTVVEVIAFEAGGVTTSVENRPDLRCEVSQGEFKASDVKEDAKK